MGHEISGYRTTDKENEIASFYRGAFDLFNFVIYMALNSLDCSGGVSGNGSKREFTKEELLNALERLGDIEDFEGEFERERKFLNDCLENIDEDGKILVKFY